MSQRLKSLKLVFSTSRVVPLTSSTIALVLLEMALNRDDLPTFVLPTRHMLFCLILVFIKVIKRVVNWFIFTEMF